MMLRTEGLIYSFRLCRSSPALGVSGRTREGDFGDRIQRRFGTLHGTNFLKETGQTKPPFDSDINKMQ